MIRVLGSDFLMKVPRGEQQRRVLVNVGRGINLDRCTRDVAALLGWRVIDGKIDQACQPEMMNQRAGLCCGTKGHNLARAVRDLLKQGDFARGNRTLKGVPINR